MSFISGLIWGLVTAAIEVALEHYGPTVGPITAGDFTFGPVATNGNFALAVPMLLVPLAVFWGWSWIANRWSGRSVVPTVLFTLGLALGVGSYSLITAFAFPQGQEPVLANVGLSVVFIGTLFVLLPSLIAAVVYSLLKSGRLSSNALVLLIGYLVGLPIPYLWPSIPMGIAIPMGTVAGTAAGHAWRSPNAKLLIAILVLILMAITVFGIPYLISSGFKPPVLPGR
ncbi:MAG TPA: hypothetical protein VGR87_05810 [Candidatus Limnocylindria bacterium]|jgi:hypothetical protein|nr:hypothetical protein [Candidatus Limnocylindria bacterium]